MAVMVVWLARFWPPLVCVVSGVFALAGLVAVSLLLTTFAVAYTLGGLVEGRRWVRLVRRRYLEAFAEWAEATLAAAPAQLEPDEELLRDRLQGEYQAAQSELGRLRQRRGVLR